MSWISSSDTSSGKNFARNLNWRGFSFLISWAETWGQRQHHNWPGLQTIEKIAFTQKKRFGAFALRGEWLATHYWDSLIPAAYWYENTGETHYVFQLSQQNSACTANLGHWRMIYHAGSDGKPIQYCTCLTENSPLSLNRYVTDCPIKKNCSYPHKNCKSTNKSTSEALALC